MFSGYFHMLERHADAVQQDREREEMDTIPTIDPDRCYCTKDNEGRFVAEASDLGLKSFPMSVKFDGQILHRGEVERDGENDIIGVNYVGATSLFVLND